MKRLPLAFAIILMIFAAGFGTLAYTYHVKNELLEDVAQIKQQVKQDNLQEAALLCSAYNEKWHEKEKQLVKFIRHNPLDSITGLCSQLEALAQNGEKAILLATLDEVSVYLEHLWEDEIPTLKNVLRIAIV